MTYYDGTELKAIVNIGRAVGYLESQLSALDEESVQELGHRLVGLVDEIVDDAATDDAIAQQIAAEQIAAADLAKRNGLALDGSDGGTLNGSGGVDD